MTRAHLSRPVLDLMGNVVTDITVRVVDPATGAQVSPLYAGPTGSPTLTQPLQFASGIINFYTDAPIRVRIGVKKGASQEVFYEDVDVLSPSSSSDPDGIEVDPFVDFPGGTLTEVLAFIYDAVTDHIADPTDAHDASAVSFVPTGTIAATDVQAAIGEVSGDVTDIDARVTTLETAEPSEEGGNGFRLGENGSVIGGDLDPTRPGVAQGYESLAIGDGAVAGEDGVVAIGYGAQAFGANGVVLGHGASASATNSVAIGYAFNVTQDYRGVIRVDDFEVRPGSSSGAPTQLLLHASNGTVHSIGINPDADLLIDGVVYPVGGKNPSGGGGGGGGPVDLAAASGLALFTDSGSGFRFFDNNPATQVTYQPLYDEDDYFEGNLSAADFIKDPDGRIRIQTPGIYAVALFGVVNGVQLNQSSSMQIRTSSPATDPYDRFFGTTEGEFSIGAESPHYICLPTSYYAQGDGVGQKFFLRREAPAADGHRAYVAQAHMLIYRLPDPASGAGDTGFSLQGIVSGELAVSNHVLKPGLRVIKAATAKTVVAHIDTPATGSPVIIDVYRHNGTTGREDIGTITINPGSGAGVVENLSVACAGGDLIRFDITQVGSDIPGADVNLSVDFE